VPAVVREIVDDGASRLATESRGERKDRRDRAVILDDLNVLGRPVARSLPHVSRLDGRIVFEYECRVRNVWISRCW
jgi:hypothetical protein